MSYFVFFDLLEYYSFFFFFQAEDGIRDTSVTGVQTCALPISSRFVALHVAPPSWDRYTAHKPEGPAKTTFPSVGCAATSAIAGMGRPGNWLQDAPPFTV